jgi:N-acetylglucosaminyldiphosphoundecaprenol N-acetyl-beta-D-mannosaminyltransferase
MKKVNLLSIAINTGTYNDFVNTIIASGQAGKSHYACVANVHMLIEAYRDHHFAEIVKNADVVTPDGKPLAWALRLLYGIRQPRVAGMTLLPDLLEAANKEQLPVYFYGGTEHVLKKTENFLSATHPELTVAGSYSPPFRKLTAEEEQEVVERINNSGARLVFVILGCPKQERWMASMKDRINAVTVGVGGALPVMLGLQQRAPEWMQQAGLEWLFRLLQEPERLFRRYAVTNSMFIYLLFKEYFRSRLARQTF